MLGESTALCNETVGLLMVSDRWIICVFAQNVKTHQLTPSTTDQESTSTCAFGTTKRQRGPLYLLLLLPYFTT